MPALELTLPQIARQEADNTISFNATGISAIATSPATFMIFYLTQADEQNGYGTVIQLDEQHQASIYPDLNPEYTYLFYKDEQGQLQTLLWCIEFSTRTTDGLYVTQAKVHGRGVTEEDMQRFNQIMLAPAASQPQTHPLAEAYMPAPATTPAEAAVASPAPMAELPTTPQPAATQPSLLSTTSPMTPPDFPAMPVDLAPTPQPVTPQPVAVPTQMQPTAEVTFPSLPPMPAELQPPAQPDPPPQSSYNQPSPQPTTSSESIVQDSPPAAIEPMALDQFNNSQNFSPTTTDQSPAKNPVGRPPKPLLTDAAWNVEQTDFAWAKSISRDSIQTNQESLRQKVQQQIRQNQPELLNNSAFVQAFDQAFVSICQTYELTPTARQDILKSLLNGRIVENLVKSLPG